ncbi:hypothetical protein A33Q_0620 [Indibacter alkaliphilus LW1]|uniref:Uncharacterized protein n=1 Tax=Indibacter alkaliphilus (strain CCUG 57479 / KCTC 22604 / LW1) TaxID=1189612 RepID=S2DJW1_INDAL|nr:hypothetical protein A33Q_0620 [Indibacter alkaliphilus LW1]
MNDSRRQAMMARMCFFIMMEFWNTWIRFPKLDYGNLIVG